MKIISQFAWIWTKTRKSLLLGKNPPSFSYSSTINDDFLKLFFQILGRAGHIEHAFPFFILTDIRSYLASKQQNENVNDKYRT